MWRGGLSGPRSVFLHADRPMLDRDGSSPLLHELFHAAVPLQAGPGGDWVIEGLAELYSLEVLTRSKTIGKPRYRKVLRRFAERGAAVTALDVDPGVGPVAARAVTALHALDGELRAGSQGRVSLDQVVARLAAERGELTTERFRRLVDEVAGRSLGAFFRAQIPLRAQPALP
jgi:predicted metalloprotease with PDZ domain